MEKLLSTSQVAEILGISRIAVHKKIKAGKLKATKVGRNYVINSSDLSIDEESLTNEQEKVIHTVVDKVIDEYGETLRLLGEE
jgi:excisionase family DNA binding protein